MIAVACGVGWFWSSSNEVKGVGHEGLVVGDTIEWTTHVVVDGTVKHLDLAVPLPLDAEFPAQQGHTVRDDSGHVVGFDFDPRVQTAVIRVREPFAPGADGLAPPIVETNAVQRLVLDGAVYTPSSVVGIERTLDDLRQPGISRDAQRDTDCLLDANRSTSRRHPAYFVADQAIREHGLAGGVRRAGEVGGLLWLAASAGFLAVLAGLAVAWRALAGLAEKETVDAYIRDEFIRPGSRSH